MSRWLNLDIAVYEGVGDYNIPQLLPETSCDASMWIGFNYCLSNRKSTEKKAKTNKFISF